MGRNGLGSAGRGAPSTGGAEMGRVLVVAASPINRIVISRTIERIYLKPTAVAPDAALNALAVSRPMMVIIDEGTDRDVLQPLLAEIARRRQGAENRLPGVVLIVEPSRRSEVSSYGEIVDATVAKPITPEVLQPVAERLAREITA
jgi:CheY-like chemotaxis protein